MGRKLYSGGSSSDNNNVWLRSPNQNNANSVYSSYGRSSNNNNAYNGNNNGLGAGFIICRRISKQIDKGVSGIESKGRGLYLPPVCPDGTYRAAAGQGC